MIPIEDTLADTPEPVAFRTERVAARTPTQLALRPAYDGTAPRWCRSA